MRSAAKHTETYSGSRWYDKSQTTLKFLSKCTVKFQSLRKTNIRKKHQPLNSSSLFLWILKILTLSFGTKIIFSSSNPILKEMTAKILKLNGTYSIVLHQMWILLGKLLLHISREGSKGYTGFLCLNFCNWSDFKYVGFSCERMFYTKCIKTNNNIFHGTAD